MSRQKINTSLTVVAQVESRNVDTQQVGRNLVSALTPNKKTNIV